MATWDDFDEQRRALDADLDTFAWHAAARRIDDLVERLARAREPMPLSAALGVLKALRRKRRFADLERLADALEQSGQDACSVHKLHAQALVDQDKLSAARGLLLALLADPRIDGEEQLEAIGLLGRVHKQYYVNARRSAPTGAAVEERDRYHLIESARRYLEGWRLHSKDRDPAGRDATWHGVNLAAVLARAERDGVDLSEVGVGDVSGVAQRVLECVDSKDPWAAATEMEANVALGRWPAAYQAASTYACNSGVDAFNFMSTLRQLVEVWGLTDGGEPGAVLLPVLNAQLSQRVGGETRFSANALRASLAALERQHISELYQRNFDSEPRRGIAWWEQGLKRCKAVARVETHAGDAVGTGFLVDPSDFFPAAPRADTPVLLTNWHVVSDEGRFRNSVAPGDACAHFEAIGRRIPLKRQLVAWNEKLDASFVALDQKLDPEVAGCPLRPPPAPFDRTKRQRVYVIGHPSGGNLSFSIHDSVLVDVEGPLLHYRTPTEDGSSGSPVFDDKNWTLVALHHAGSEKMPRLRGMGTYEANEGITIASIREAVAAQLKS